MLNLEHEHWTPLLGSTVALNLKAASMRSLETQWLKRKQSFQTKETLLQLLRNSGWQRWMMCTPDSQGHAIFSQPQLPFDQERKSTHVLHVSLNYNMAAFPNCSCSLLFRAKICHAFLPSFGFHNILSKEGKTLLLKCKRNKNISGKAPFKKLICTVMPLVGLKTSTK